MTLRALLAVLALLSGDPRLVPGQRLEGVERVVLEVAEPGTYTLGRSNGALVLGEQRSDEGWLVVELAAGAHLIELPGGSGDVTAFAGVVERSTPAIHLDRGTALLNGGAREAARVEFLAVLSSPAFSGLHGAARMFLAEVLRLEGRLEDARSELLATREAVASLGLPNFVAFGENCLGQVALALGDKATAREAFERLTKTSGDAAMAALAETRLGELAEVEHDQEGARSHHEEALRRAAALEERYYVSEIAAKAGRFYEKSGDLERSAALYEIAAGEAQVWTQELAARGQLANIFVLLGKYGPAAACLDRVSALGEEHRPSPYDRYIAQTRLLLAFNLGDYHSASELVDGLAALATGDEQSALLADRATILEVQGELDAAREIFEKVLATPTPDLTRWRALFRLANLHSLAGRLDVAARFAAEALDVARTLGSPQHEAMSRIGMSHVEVMLGHAKEARELADFAVDELRREGLDGYLLSGMRTQAEAALLGGDLPMVTSLLEEAWERTGREEVASMPSIEAAHLRSHYASMSNWSAVAADLLAQLRANAPEDGNVLATGLRWSTRWRARGLLEGLGRASVVPDSLQEVLARTIAGRTFVNYLAGREQLYALVLDSAGLRWVDLGLLRPIEEDVSKYLAGMQTENLASIAEVSRLGRRLFDSLLAPLRIATEQLIISPTPELARLPFEALVAASSDAPASFADLSFALDQWEIGYAPSAASIVALSDRPHPEKTFAVLFGDPAYASSDSSLLAARSIGGASLPRLPHTRGEACRIAELLLLESGDELASQHIVQLAKMENGEGDELSTPIFDIRLGTQATTAALKLLARDCTLLHVAAHGHVDPWDARRTGLVLAWNAEDHGVLCLADIALLELSADLVVLSACRTADGRILHGEGVQSMAQAFLLAGARGVVATLWPVWDPQSELLMEHFTRAYLLRERSVESALREAKQAVRNAELMRGIDAGRERSDSLLGHPHYWAPFVYSGAPSPIRR